MVECSACGKEIDEKAAVKLTVKGRTYHFCDESCLSNFHMIRHQARRILSSVVLNKTFAELVAIGTGIGGIAYTLQGVAYRALVMDTLSAVAAIGAFIVGVEHLRYLREHNLLGKAVLLAGIGITLAVVLIVWHFGFILGQI